MIAPELLKSPYTLGLSEQQKEIVTHKQGPLRVIAGPGSGKTRSITLLAMNLLLCGDARPSEIVLCTYTEKAARELQDRLSIIAESVNYSSDLTQMKVGTIHGICQQLISEYPHRVELGNNYETLDQFSQQLLVFEHMDEICEHSGDFLLKLWQGSRWKIAKNLCSCFDRIAEELNHDTFKEATRSIYSSKSTAKDDTYVRHITRAYSAYQRILNRTNSIDFAHLQKCAYNLLSNPLTRQKITKAIKYVLVDEYQDTNYIQEHIVTLLASGTNPKNLCVIGDEDQSLYRFRGASVRNILQFPDVFPDCKQIELTDNYRSHQTIISVCNQWISSYNWTNAKGDLLRTQKEIKVAPDKNRPDYQSVVTLLANDVDDEAEQVATFVYSLKEKGRIKDYSQVALLLHSVRSMKSGAYMKAFAARGIQCYCPRARTFFYEYEVCLVIGCFARILGYQKGMRPSSEEEVNFLHYIRECRELLVAECQKRPLLERELRFVERALNNVEEEGQSQRLPSLAACFYRLLFLDPLDSYRKDSERRHNLMLLSKLLKTFQQHFHHTTITQNNVAVVRADFFQHFLYLLYLDENNLDEGQHEPSPEDHVQIMTIYQAKGLEFPVVIVGRLDEKPTLFGKKDAALQRHNQTRFLEAENQIDCIDSLRLYYVAFSRAKDILLLSANRTPHPFFASLWKTFPAWLQTRERIATLPRKISINEPVTPRPRYGFTSHIQTYMDCPRRYEFFYEHRFVSSRPTEAFFGLLVHQTIERIHRRVLDGELASLDESQIRGILEKVHMYLLCTNMQPVSNNEKEKAFEQVLRYFYHTYENMKTIQAAELNVHIEREKYVLTGKLDVLMKKDDTWEIRDLKTMARFEDDALHLTRYKQQLYLYAHALEKRIDKAPLRLSLYWTAEERSENALMSISYRPEDIQQAVYTVDGVAAKIQQRDFDVVSPPSFGICRVCDVRHLCKRQGIVAE